MEQITFETNPFAFGSYKKVYNTKPALPTSQIKFDNINPDKEKIISKTNIYYDTQTVDEKTQALANAISELEMQMMFYSVNLAPKIYAIYFVVIKSKNGKHEHFHFIYYLDNAPAVAEVYQQIQEHLSFANNEHLYLLVLSDACVKQNFYNLIGTRKPIATLKHAFELIDTYVQKIVHNQYLFLDFKPSNMCVSLSPTINIVGLDFDRKFIIHFSKIPLPADVVARISRTYMFILAVLIISDNFSRDRDTIKMLVRTHHITGQQIKEMIKSFVELEKNGYQLCRNKYNPLSMLAYYLLTSRYLESSDVYNCIDLSKPINTWHKIKDQTLSMWFLSKYPNIKQIDLVGYDFIKFIIINELFGVAEYASEKSGTNHLTSPYVSTEVADYKARITPLATQPVIPYFDETVIELPDDSNKKLKTKGGKKSRKRRI